MWVKGNRLEMIFGYYFGAILSVVVIIFSFFTNFGNILGLLFCIEIFMFVFITFSEFDKSSKSYLKYCDVSIFVMSLVYSGLTLIFLIPFMHLKVIYIPFFTIYGLLLLFQAGVFIKFKDFEFQEAFNSSYELKQLRFFLAMLKTNDYQKYLAKKKFIIEQKLTNEDKEELLSELNQTYSDIFLKHAYTFNNTYQIFNKSNPNITEQSSKELKQAIKKSFKDLEDTL